MFLRSWELPRELDDPMQPKASEIAGTRQQASCGRVRAPKNLLVEGIYAGACLGN